MTPVAAYIVETLVTLVAVIALAVLVLVGARRLGLGRATGPLELIGRLPLEARRAVYLVRVLDRVFVLGASEAGLEKIAEFDGSNLTPFEEPKSSFQQALARVLARGQQQQDSNTSSKGNSDASGG
jgi:flagellar biogenesis protein FliO